MVALLDYKSFSPRTEPAPQRRAHLALVPAGRSGQRPVLVSSLGVGQSVLGPWAEVLERRVVLVLAGVFAALFVVMMLQGGPPSEAAVVSAPMAVESPGLSESTVVAKPGDTLWAIAESLERDGDVRAVVAALAERNGGDTLRVGQIVIIPANLG